MTDTIEITGTDYISEYQMLTEICSLLCRSDLPSRYNLDAWMIACNVARRKKEDEVDAMRYPMMKFRKAVYEAAKATENIHAFIMELYDTGCMGWYSSNVLDKYSLH